MEVKDAFPNDKIDVNVNTTHNSDLKFSVNGTEILRLTDKGAAMYMGRPIKKDFHQIYYGLKKFLLMANTIHEQTIKANEELRMENAALRSHVERLSYELCSLQTEKMRNERTQDIAGGSSPN